MLAVILAILSAMPLAGPSIAHDPDRSETTIATVLAGDWDGVGPFTFEERYTDPAGQYVSEEFTLDPAEPRFERVIPERRDGARIGGYRLTLLSAPEGATVTDFGCLEFDPETGVDRPLTESDDPGLGAELGLRLRPDQFVTCTLEAQAPGEPDSVGSDADEAGPSPSPEALTTPDDTRDVALAPKPGRWRAVNAAGAIKCGGISTAVPETTDTGRLQVKKGGRRIVFVGKGPKVVLDQVEGRPGIYRGSVNDKSLGASVPLKYEVQVIDPEHFEGILNAKFKAGGQKCTLSRDFDSKYIGK